MEISSVKKLREAIKDLPDDTPVFSQVVAEDGSAWNLNCEFHSPNDKFTMAVLQMSHKTLKTLSGINEEEKGLLQEFIGNFNNEDIGALSGEFEYWWFTNGKKVEEIINK